MKTLIAVPCFDMVHTDFMSSLMALQRTEDTSFTVVKNTLIHVARGVIANNAIEAGFDRVMWFDSDMKFAPDTLMRLSADMDQGLDLVSGLYFTRRPPVKPVVYSTLWYHKDEDGIDVGAGNYFTYPEGLAECAGVGFGCCLTSVGLLKDVSERFGAPFDHIPTMGEDMAFCHRARQLGAMLLLDTGVKCGHIGQVQITEETFKGLRA